MTDSVRPQILRVLEGESEALAWLYDSFAPLLLRRLTARFGGVPHLDPEDLLQDTYLYVLGRECRALRRFLARTPPESHGRTALEQFLWSAACGLASNRMRSLLRRPTVPLGERGDLVPEPGGEGHTVARNALERLGDCLARRGERFYLYFQLRYLDGLKPAEITYTTGWSRKKTYKLKQELDQALDRCLAQLGLTEP